MIMLRRLRIISAVVFLMAIVAWGCSYFSPWVFAWNWIFRMEHGTVNILWMTTGSKNVCEKASRCRWEGADRGIWNGCHTPQT